MNTLEQDLGLLLASDFFTGFHISRMHDKTKSSHTMKFQLLCMPSILLLVQIWLI